jgi:hypothetical protein
MFTRRHYVAIARILAAEQGASIHDIANRQTEYLTRSLADMFAVDNPRFKRDTFLRASGIRPE